MNTRILKDALPTLSVQYKDLQANMETIYSTATICDFNKPNKCDLTLEPGKACDNLFSNKTVQSSCRIWTKTFNLREENLHHNFCVSDIEAIMASSHDWDELTYVWEEWRDKTGKLMRDNFTRFVELSNEAAILDGQFSFFSVII